MADILEAMGFPKDWCELALRNSSGLEAAIDLLLNWQTYGPPPSFFSQERHFGSSSAPILRLSAVPETLSGSQSRALENQSVAQVADPVVSHSSFTGFLDGGTVASQNILSTSSQGEITELGRRAQTFSDNQSVVEDSIGGAGAGPSRHSREAIEREVGKSKIGENVDAVVPDALAEERKRRTAAALLAKKEKEIEKARIRKQLKEDRENRHARQNFAVRSDAQKNANIEHQVGRMEVVGASCMKTHMVELQIRCQDFPTMKASFNAAPSPTIVWMQHIPSCMREASLKDVRGFVEQTLDQTSSVSPYPEDSLMPNQRWTPFSGPAAKLTSSRNEEAELLQAARDNFKVQTNRIIAEAKSLRRNNSSAIASDQKRGKIYFLVPFPRREFFTESSLEITLSQAQLLPKETLIVHFRPEEDIAMAGKHGLSQVLLEGGPTNHLCHEASTQGFFETQVCETSANEELLTEVPCLALESSSNRLGETHTRTTQQRSTLGKNHSRNQGRSRGHPDSRALEVTGNQVQMREHALQAAANRMKEAAQILREGLPPEKGEVEGVFQCPSNSENPYLDSDKVQVGKFPAIQSVEESLQTGHYETDSRSKNKEKHISGLNQGPRDFVHSQAMLAAEARLHAAQGQPETSIEKQLSYPQVQVNDLWFSVQASEQSKVKIPASSRLLSRPEKMQKTVDDSPSITRCRGLVPEESGCANFDRVLDAGTDARHIASRLRSSENFLRSREQENGKATAEQENNKVIAQHYVLQESGASSSHGIQAEALDHFSTLRIRLEDGTVITHKCSSSTELQTIRDSVVPDDADPSGFGLVILFPEPHFMTGEDLLQTLDQVGLVPRGTLHLSRISARGIVRQGGRNRRRSMFPAWQNESNEYPETWEHSSHGLEDLTYEDIEDLQESIGRVYVGVPEAVISALPTHVKEKKDVASLPTESVIQKPAIEDEAQLCIVCIEELMGGELVMSLPCLHAFHSVCIRQWLRQSRCCPTCKYEVI
ncbi:hypothetical protein O6H91_07G077600 [Diphasiastrum complanatum]|uniref:Uncharacterized protein n=1 Tax=Diphasiastrum complanatum TaxID=34168 RepID=A0ACC2D6Y1_DIPCM|nr:hypothetical protein O6H91_07G077600 [Diphasiastrum complanatum]